MAATAGHRLILDPMGKCSNMNIMRYEVNVNETTTPKSNCIRNAFFSETINQTQSKLHRNVHWIVLYKVYVFYSDMKSKAFINIATVLPMSSFINHVTILPMSSWEQKKQIYHYTMHIQIFTMFANISIFATFFQKYFISKYNLTTYFNRELSNNSI